MSEKKCPACGVELAENAAKCPICGLTGLDQVFLSEEAYQLWKNNILEVHLQGIVKVDMRYIKRDYCFSVEFDDLTVGTLLFIENTGNPYAILKPTEKGPVYRINRLTRLGTVRDEHYEQLTISSDAGDFLLHKYFLEGRKTLGTVRKLLKALLPPFEGPSNLWRDMDDSCLCTTDCLLVGHLGIGLCSEKGAMCNCDSVCTDIACNGDCDHGCRCDGYCTDCDCDSDYYFCRLDH